MVRKSQKVAFESISADVAASIILATTGTVKDKTVDPRKQIGTIHIKKYLAVERINNQYESWIALLRKSIQAKEDGALIDLTNEEKTLHESILAKEKALRKYNQTKKESEGAAIELTAEEKASIELTAEEETFRKSFQAKKESIPLDLTAEEQTLLDTCKRLTQEYLSEHGSDALKQTVDEQTAELEQLKNIASSMKYKFSTYSFEVITHMINLMVRELLVFTCDSCLSKSGKLTKEAHVPWSELQNKMLSGLYMNTPLVYGILHGTNEVDESDETEEDADESDETEETPETEGDATDVAEGDDKPKVKKFRPKLTQYITNAFKEITTREPRFHGLLLGKEVTAVVNNLIYQVMDRYVNVIKSLLLVGNSKTITDHLAVIATIILLRDDIHTTEEDVQVIVDLLQERVEAIKASKPKKDDTDVASEAADESVVATPEPTAPKAKKGKKSA
jgi:hypothetical protein